MIAAPEFEIDNDGYPTDESLAAWDALAPMDIGPNEAARFLVNVLPVLNLGCGHVSIADEIDNVFERPVKNIMFVTGGWSGAEDIIGTILKHFWIRHYHSKWERGGAFWFKVPLTFLVDAELPGGRK